LDSAAVVPLTHSLTQRLAILVYGVFAYVRLLGVFLYAIGWIGNIVVPRGIDGVPAQPLGIALLVNVGLILPFGVQHCVMARPGPYDLVRHPLYVGWLMVFRWEKRDLVAHHGRADAEYCRRVPMVIPGLRSKPDETVEAVECPARAV
jgi:protein-S-isoprenylcysteine O-methyltransferase Ste14